MIYIYTLEHPITGEIKYIGKTNNIAKRLIGHISDLREINKKSNWILSLLSQNLKPVISILEEVAENNWEEAEIYWIAQFKAWGFRLVNGNEGGDGSPPKIINDKRRQSYINRRNKPNTKTFKICHSYNTDGTYNKTFNSLTEASKELDIPLSNIGAAIKNRKLAKKFYWSYAKLDKIDINPIYDINGKYIVKKENIEATKLRNTIMLKGKKWTEEQRSNLSRIRKESNSINNIKWMRNKEIQEGGLERVE